MVVDTSALLAIVFNEPSGLWVLDQLLENEQDLQMSTVNYAEALILIANRQSHMLAEIRDHVAFTSIRMIPPTETHAELAASARSKYPLNLGDCFAYALAKSEEAPLITLDRDFRKTDLKVIFP
jgi:ribonuclease VapC